MKEALAKRLPTAAITLTFVLGFCVGAVATMATGATDKPCPSGQVYVVDTGRCATQPITPPPEVSTHLKRG